MHFVIDILWNFDKSNTKGAVPDSKRLKSIAWCVFVLYCIKHLQVFY